MSKFKIGDRVKFVGYDPRFSGKSGTVVDIIGLIQEFVIGVRFDEFIPSAHTLNGKCENNHGWWLNENQLILIEDEPRFNVIITSVGDVTTAKLLHGKKVEKEDTVKRYCKDEYSEKEAVKNVCAKLFGEDKPEEEPEPIGINCKAVCIDGEGWSFTRGKVYEFSDGRCFNDAGDLYPAIMLEKIIIFDNPLFANYFIKLVDTDE